MTVVYRVENHAGLGPYTAEVWGLSVGDAPNRPMPENDGFEYEQYDHERAAFASLDQLTDWFDTPAQLEALRQDRFYVYAVTVPEMWLRIGRSQVLIDHDEDNPDPRELVPWAKVKKVQREKISQSN